MHRWTFVPGLIALAACATPAAPSLESQLRASVAGFGGDVGIYVRHLRHGTTVALRADELFPTASLIKVPILCGLMARLARGEIDARQPLVYDASRAYDEEDLSANLKAGTKLELDKLIWLMCSLSDNTASLWLQELAGTGTAINEWLARNGFVHTRVNSRTPGREDARSSFGWGQTTPREMAELLVTIHERRAVDSAASERMLRALARTYWDKEAVAMVPVGVATISKQGAVNRSRSEVLLVHGRHGEYVLCVITKNQADQSWGRDNAGYELLRAVSKLVYDYFEGQR